MGIWGSNPMLSATFSPKFYQVSTNNLAENLRKPPIILASFGK